MGAQIKNEKMKIEKYIPVVALFSLAGCGANSESVAERPNVILIMADDLGYSDISCYGSTTVSTPNIDKLAEEGLKLTDYHTNGAVSSPTRAALMTGKYQQRTGVTGVITAANHRDVGLAIEEPTIADRLSELGYNCAIFGKWHLGYSPAHNPTLQGFDEFRGFVAGNIDYHAFVDEAGYYDMWNGVELDREAKGYITDLITQNSVNFIEKNNPTESGEPFFLYVPYPAPHYPYQSRDDEPVREEGNKKYIRKVAKEDSPRIYIDIIEQMDEGVGAIVECVNRLGLGDNTMIIFCSDNGPNGSGNTGGYRGRKGSVYEGGHRVPAVIKYPAAIAPQQISDVAMMGMDLFPTFVEMAGGEIVDELDGVSFVDYFESGVVPAKRNLFWAHNNRVAMRDTQDWKLIEIKGEDGVSYELYNLAEDPFEQSDLSASETERVEDMAKAIGDWQRDVYSQTPSILN